MKSRNLFIPFLFIASFTLPAKANTFDVFCVPSVDGVSSCTGWKGSQSLTCVASRGGVASCKSTTGDAFNCVQEAGGVTTCQSPPNDSMKDKNNNNCTFIGNGSFSCDKDPQKVESEVIKSPSVGNPFNLESQNNQIPHIDFDLTLPNEIP